MSEEVNETEFEQPEEFQQAMERLRELAGQLENGNLPLEKAMDNYREGRFLIEFCEKKLSEAELIVEEVDDSNPEKPELNRTEMKNDE